MYVYTYVYGFHMIRTISRGCFRNISHLPSVMDVPCFGEVGTEVLYVAIEFFNVDVLVARFGKCCNLSRASRLPHTCTGYISYTSSPPPPSRVVTRFESEVFSFTLEVILK
jgi:hypothetical protein